jgi:hypothetical protein
MEIAFQKGDVDRWLRDDAQRMKASRRCATGRAPTSSTGCASPRRCAARQAARVASSRRRGRRERGDGAARRRRARLLLYAARRTIQLWLNGDVYLDLYRRTQPDFSCMILYGTDNLAHKFWKFHFPDDFDLPREQAAPFAKVLTDYYERPTRCSARSCRCCRPRRRSRSSPTTASRRTARRRLDPARDASRPDAAVEMAGVIRRGRDRAGRHARFRPARSSDVAAAQRANEQLVAFFERCVVVEGGKRAFT